MKKTLLFSTVLFFSTVSFAQTTVKNSEAINNNTHIQSNKNNSQVSNSGNASSATSIQSHEVNKVEGKSYAEIKKEKKVVAAEKNTIETQSKVQEPKKLAFQDQSVLISTHSNTKVNASAKDNNLSNNTFVKNSATLSTAEIKKKGNQLKAEKKAVIKTQAKATVENSNRVKANVNKTAVKAGKKINTISSTAVKSGAASIQIRPVVKTRTMVKTNAGIKIN